MFPSEIRAFEKVSTFEREKIDHFKKQKPPAILFPFIFHWRMLYCLAINAVPSRFRN